MTAPAVILWLNAAVFTLYGVAFALDPEAMSQLVTGAAPSAGPALTDMRATYGGMSIGLGVLFALAARSSAGQRLGLAGVLAVMLGMATTRALGIVFDGDPNGAMFAYLAVEIVVAGVAIWALRRAPGD